MTAWIANCLPLGTDGKYFLIGAALYTHGNVWGIANPPADWNVAEKAAPSNASTLPADSSPALKINKKQWPYNLFSDGNETHLRRK